MKDELLLGVLPYAVLALFVTGAFVRLVPGSRKRGVDRGRRNPAHFLSWSWRIGLGGVLLGHLTGFLFPGALQAIHQRPGLLLLVEGVGVVFGVLALAGLALETLSPHGRLHPRSFLDTVALTLLGMALASGLAMTILFRNAPSWYGAILVPYLWSLFSFEPRVGLVASLPFCPRAHVLAVFLLLAVAPWTSAGSWAASKLRSGRSGGRDRDSSPSAAPETA